MISTDSYNLNSFHRKNFVIWRLFLIGITLLSLLVIILNYIKIFPYLGIGYLIDNILFLIAVALALFIIIVKRSIFSPVNMVNAIIKKSTANREKMLLNQIRKNYIIVWSMGSLICLVGIIDYIFFIHIRFFLVYMIVSLYSLLINFPRLSLLEKSMEILKKNL